MKTVSVNVYSFDELTEEAKTNAIEQVRQQYYEYNEFASWAVDDCSLFEPKEKELQDILGTDYNFPLIKNNRKDIYFSTDRNYFLDCEKAMEVTNDEHFYKWLGITDDFLLQTLSYSIYTPSGRNADTTIKFEVVDDYEELTEEENKILILAEEKFNDHIKDILKRIENDIDYRFTDEAIIDDIQANDYEFLEEGTIY